MLDLGGPLSDLEGKNSKFRRITFLRMVTKNISMRFQHSPIKTVGGVRKSTKKCTKMTSLSQINGNDLGDLDFDLVTLRSSGCVDLVYTYLWYEYDDYQRSLRLS